MEALPFPSLGVLCQVPGARCKESGVLHTKQSTKHQAPSNPAPLRSGHGLLIFDCVHGPFSFGPHRPLADAYWSRMPRAGDTPALGYPTVYQLAGALGPIGNGGCDIHSPLCSCLHWLSLCLLLASSLPAAHYTVLGVALQSGSRISVVLLNMALGWQRTGQGVD